MSNVYLARDLKQGKLWAIKESPDTKNFEDYIGYDAIIKEAEILKTLRHPGIPQYKEMFKENNRIYLVMEYLEGDNLEELVEKKGVFSETEAISFGIKICRILKYLHKQNPPVIYRDLKPSNIIVKETGDLALIDFGAARRYIHKRRYDTINLGTKDYAAPEQYKGAMQTDMRTDIFNLGATIFHLTTGHPPEKYPINFHKNKKTILSDKFEAIIMKCTQENPDDRYQSCDELLNALRHLNEQEERVNRLYKRRITLFSVLIFLGCVAAGLFIFINQNVRYKQLISQGARAQQNEIKIEYFEKAAGIRPYDSYAYLSILNIYVSDGKFDEKEEAGYREILERNHPLFGNTSKFMWNLKKEEYLEILYETGKSYWYFYGLDDLDEVNVQGIRNSVWWFEKMLEVNRDSTSLISADWGTNGVEDEDNVKAARTYLQIADIYTQSAITDDINYLKLFNAMEMLIQINDGEPDGFRRKDLKLILSMIESYGDNFIREEINKERIDDLAEMIEKEMKQIEK